MSEFVRQQLFLLGLQCSVLNCKEVPHSHASNTMHKTHHFNANKFAILWK